MAQKKSKLESSVENVVDTFHKYAEQQGNKDALNEKEFKQLVKNDMPNMLKQEKQKEEAMHHMMEDLDTDQNSQIDFYEFVDLLGRVLISKHEEVHKNTPSTLESP